MVVGDGHTDDEDDGGDHQKRDEEPCGPGLFGFLYLGGRDHHRWLICRIDRDRCHGGLRCLSGFFFAMFRCNGGGRDCKEEEGSECKCE